MQAIRIHQTGGIEKLEVDQAPVPTISKNQVLIKVHYAGVNYIDTYHRSGVYPVQLPFIPGSDGSGVVVEVGEEANLFSVGDRVAFYCSGGSYAEYVAVDAKSVVKVPEGVDLETGCACIVQGMTAHYLTHSTHKVNPGDNVLIHAAAGGTGQFLIQAAKLLGGRVIGTVGSVEKKEFLEKEFPGVVDDIIVYGKGVNVAQEVRKLTQGKGVNVVYDGVGKDTFEQSLDSLAIRGHFVSFGNASGVVPAFSPLELTKRGSLSFTRPKMGDYVLDRKEFDWRASDLFSWIKAGKFKVNVHTVYPSLAQAGKAHAEIEGRKTLGKILLKVASNL